MSARDPGAEPSPPSWAKHRKPILLALLVAGFSQLSGINAPLYHLNDISKVAAIYRPTSRRS